MMDRQEHNVPPEDPAPSPADPPIPEKEEVKTENETSQDPVQVDTAVQEKPHEESATMEEEPSGKEGFGSSVS